MYLEVERSFLASKPLRPAPQGVLGQTLLLGNAPKGLLIKKKG
jgi:hypothetical protein